jgi:hypothetical protein
MKELRRELCRLILGKFGLVPPPNFGKVGISTKEFLLSKTIKIEFEDELGNVSNHNFGLWSGSIMYNGSKVRVLATDICDNKINYHEFIATYIVDKSPVNGIRVIYGEEDYGLFIVKTDKWKPVSVANMLMSAAGFEQMSNIGLVWTPCDEYDDLYGPLKEVLDNV